MDTQSTKYLPGGFDQYLKLSKAIDLNNKKILFIGSGLERLLLKIDLSLFPSVYYIIEDHESLISTRYLLSGIKGINIRMMEFDNTDFSPDEFDVVYVQGSIASDKRNKIVKEVKRILKPGGVFCVGESVKLVTDIPQFVKDMYDNSGIAPLDINEFSKYFNERKFEILFEEDLSYTLKKYYKSWNDVLNENLKKLSDEEKQQNKKLIKRIGHESKAYNNLGGSKYMGFKMLILKKESDEER